MNTEIIFHKGTKGSGVVIELIYDHARVLFDFGAPFEPLAQIYDGKLNKRLRSRVKDALLLEQIPYIDGVFPASDIADIDLISAEDSQYDTLVLISHLHLDHMSGIDLIHPDIPVYMHFNAYKLQKCLEEIGESVHYRDYSYFEYEQMLTIGQIEIIPFFSDHPCYGSSGFLIKTPTSTVFYSGDIRFHGLQSKRAFDELTKISKTPIDLLIIDGTTYSNQEFTYDADQTLLSVPSKKLLDHCLSENDIYRQLKDELSKTTALGVFNIYHRDLQLITALIKMAKSTKREIVFEPKTAYLVHELLAIRPKVIDLENNTLVLDQRSYDFVDKQAIIDHPEHYLIQNSYVNILELIDYRHISGIYFHLFGEPFVSATKEYKIMTNVIANLAWRFVSYTNLYAFNHAYPNHLAYMIAKLNAKTVVAVHSRSPEKMNPVHSKQIFPIEKITYLLVNGDLIEKAS